MGWATRTVETATATRRVLVVSRTGEDVVGAEALRRLRAGEPLAYDHAELARAVAADPEPVHCVVLRGRGADGSGQFRMARDLDDHELVEVGYRLTKAQLAAWQPLLSGGLLAVARVELRIWELAALRSGTAKLVAELKAEAAGRGNGADAAVAAQIRTLELALLNFGAGLDTAMSDVIPQRLESLGASPNR